jgi:hypothetical protein
MSGFYVDDYLRDKVKQLTARIQRVEAVIKDAKRQLATGEPAYVGPAFTLQELLRVQGETQELATAINEDLRASIKRGLTSRRE